MTNSTRGFLKVGVIGMLICGGFLSAGEKDETQTKKEDTKQAQTEKTSEAKSGLVNINAATLDQLTTLPRIGPSIGQRILDFRKEHGQFKKLEELMNVKGIGPKTYEKLKVLISL